MSLVADLAVQCSALEEQLAAFQREQPECWCETCRCIHPVQQAGRILQPCPTCSQEMTPTSFNLRLIATLRKELDALTRQVTALTEERNALNAVIRYDYVEVKNWQLQLAGYQAYSALLREALEFIPRSGSMLGAAAEERRLAALALPTDDTVLRKRLAAERERCAKVCDPKKGFSYVAGYYVGITECAAAIRSLS